ncbi:MAG: hypothetical protein FWH41_07890 [Treponema sp.]|nr:hypothetical protein [Treponema sp.]
MKDFDNYSTFESINEFEYELVTMTHEYQISHNSKEYFLSRYPMKGKKIFTIATNWQNEDPFEYDSLDEMLDNFKAEDGKSLREFILEAKVVYEY